MDIYRDTKVFVLCPAQIQSGGPFLLHQLAHHLRRRRIPAFMSYISATEGNPVPAPYRKYHIPFLKNAIENNEHNILIIPESTVGTFPNHIRKIIWWLSVDNWLGAIINMLQEILRNSFSVPIPEFIRVPGNQSITHWAQSEYAYEFLQRNGVAEEQIYRVEDYLDPLYLARHADDDFMAEKRRDWVAFNPKKGEEFTRQLQKAAPDIQWKPIKHMTTEEVEECLSQTKVYIDFGNHPGKDRIPREAAICGCCIVTGKRGAAGNDIDVPIPEQYKFEDKSENIPAIIAFIRKILRNYSEMKHDFAAYRQEIQGEKAVFERALEQAFSLTYTPVATKRLAFLKADAGPLDFPADWEKRENAYVAVVVDDARAGESIKINGFQVPVISNEDAVFLYREGRLDGFLRRDDRSPEIFHMYS